MNPYYNSFSETDVEDLENWVDNYFGVAAHQTLEGVDVDYQAVQAYALLQIAHNLHCLGTMLGRLLDDST